MKIFSTVEGVPAPYGDDTPPGSRPGDDHSVGDALRAGHLTASCIPIGLALLEYPGPQQAANLFPLIGFPRGRPPLGVPHPLGAGQTLAALDGPSNRRRPASRRPRRRHRPRASARPIAFTGGDSGTDFRHVGECAGEPRFPGFRPVPCQRHVSDRTPMSAACQRPRPRW